MHAHAYAIQSNLFMHRSVTALLLHYIYLISMCSRVFLSVCVLCMAYFVIIKNSLQLRHFYLMLIITFTIRKWQNKNFIHGLNLMHSMGKKAQELTRPFSTTTTTKKKSFALDMSILRLFQFQ